MSIDIDNATGRQASSWVITRLDGSPVRLRAGCEDDAIAGRHLSLEVLREVARSLSADGFPELSRYLTPTLN